MGLTKPVARAPNYKVLSTDWNEFRDNLAYLYDNSRGIAYVPTWSTSGTPPTLGNGTLAGVYGRYGKWVTIKFSLAIGSSGYSGGTGRWQFALPVTAAATDDVFSAMLIDVGGQFYSGVGFLYSTGLLGVTFTGDTSSGQIDTTHPFTWGSGDQLRVSGQYLAAAD